uniref:Uncharacterized protein n=1 Tax=Panagrellus redivivus TaxID=6233 RepID=A0A7E4ULF1_PANRE
MNRWSRACETKRPVGLSPGARPRGRSVPGGGKTTLGEPPAPATNFPVTACLQTCCRGFGHCYPPPISLVT